MEELDLRDLLEVIVKRWWIIAALTIAAGIISILVSFFVLQPVYQSDTVVYVGKDTEVNQNSGIGYNDIMLNDRLVNDYRELVKTRQVSDMIIKKLGMEDITVDKMADKLTVESKKDTHFIVISATDADPETARDIANTAADVFEQRVVDIMKVQNVQIVDKAEVPAKPVKPNKKMNVAIAVVLGMMLGFGVVFLMEYLDNTIKTPEDVEKHLGLPVIGTIPVFPD